MRIFYTTSRRKTTKRLPKGKYENDEADNLVRLKIRSQRFPVKCVFMGVIARPLLHRNFDGKILLERASEQVEVTRQTAHTNVTDDVLINTSLKNGEWRILFQDITPVSMDYLVQTIVEHYCFD